MDHDDFTREWIRQEARVTSLRVLWHLSAVPSAKLGRGPKNNALEWDNKRHVRTPPIIFIVKCPFQERAQFLEIGLGLVQRKLESANLLKLVRRPVPLIGKHEQSPGIANGVGDIGQQRADGVILTAVIL